MRRRRSRSTSSRISSRRAGWARPGPRPSFPPSPTRSLRQPASVCASCRSIAPSSNPHSIALRGRRALKLVAAPYWIRGPRIGPSQRVRIGAPGFRLAGGRLDRRRNRGCGNTAEELLQLAAQLLRVLKLAIGHVAHLVELAQQRGLDRGMLPHREKHWRAGLGKDVVADFECSALAQRRSDVEEGIGAAQLTQPIAAEIHRVEHQPLALLEPDLDSRAGFRHAEWQKY